MGGAVEILASILRYITVYVGLTQGSCIDCLLLVSLNQGFVYCYSLLSCLKGLAMQVLDT